MGNQLEGKGNLVVFPVRFVLLLRLPDVFQCVCMSKKKTEVTLHVLPIRFLINLQNNVILSNLMATECAFFFL